MHVRQEHIRANVFIFLFWLIRMVVKRSSLFLVGILVLSSFASAGLFDWFGNITGKATSDTTAMNITVGNNAPTISNVAFVSAQTPTESGTKTVTVVFNVTDADGVENINDTGSAAQFDRAGEPSRYNATCVWVADYAGADTAEYSCTIDMWYYDYAGDWTINVSGTDINGAGARDTGDLFTYNLFTGMVMSPTAMGWPALGVANTDIGSNSDPIVLNNTGNDNALSINVTGRDLQGETATSEYIYAGNFTVDSATEGCSGVAMDDSVSTNITSAILERGNNSINAGDDTSGQEELFFCLKELPQAISAQSYSTSGTGPWTIQIIS